MTDRPDETGMISDYGNVHAEYEAAANGVGLHDRGYRGLLEVSGADRLSWLHNLTTNHVKTLQPGQGNYAFAVNVQGRILFDMNILAQSDTVWLDVDRRWIERARTHFDKYLIVEDVTVTDRSDEFVRLGLTGKRVPQFIARQGLSQACALPLLQLERFSCGDVPLAAFRDDFCGPFGLQVFVPREDATALRQRWTESTDAVPVGFDAVDTLRLENGLPWPVADFTPDTLPAETGQFERAVSINKGCYLGQEIVERMRSRGALARRLVLIRLDDSSIPPSGAAIRVDDTVVGQVTSARRSFAHDAPLAMGYVRASLSDNAPVVVEAEGQRSAGTIITAPALSH